MFKLIKLAPLILMAWRWYKTRKAQQGDAGYNANASRRSPRR
jgi:hypothetical protein